MTCEELFVVLIEGTVLQDKIAMCASGPSSKVLGDPVLVITSPKGTEGKLWAYIQCAITMHCWIC